MSLMRDVTQNTAEDITFLVGYSVVNKYLSELLESEFPNEVDEDGRPTINIAKEVVSGMSSYLLTSAMFQVIQREEQFITWLFAGAEALITVLYLRNKVKLDAISNKIKNYRGVKAINRLGIFNSQSDPQNSFVSQVYQATQAIMQGRTVSRTDVASTLQSSNSSIDTALNREQANFKFAKANNDAFQNSLMIKLATGTFTALDKQILQKVIGRSDFKNVPLEIDELNKINEFMLVKDSSGKFTGLTSAFVQMLNGLGYIHK